MRIFLTGLILMMAPVLHAGEQRPCSIMLKFGHDKFGPVALYNLTLQTTNRTGRDVWAHDDVFVNLRFKDRRETFPDEHLSVLAFDEPMHAIDEVVEQLIAAF